MALIITCSSGHKMSVGEDLQGKRVRCPQCQEVVTVPAQALPALPEPPRELAQHVQVPLPPPGPTPIPYDRDYGGSSEQPRRDDRYDRGRDRDYDRGMDYGRERDIDRGYDRGRPRHDDDRSLTVDEVSQLQTVSLGLAFMAWQYLLMMVFVFVLAGIVIMLISMDVMRFRRFAGRGFIGGRGSGEEIMEMLAIGATFFNGLVLLVMVVFMFLSSGLCCRAPRRTGGFGFALAALLSFAATFLFAILFVILVIASDGRVRDAMAAILFILFVLGILMLVAGHIMQSLFMFRMGGYVRDPKIRGWAIGTMVAWLVSLVIGAAIIILTIIVAQPWRRPGDFPVVIFIILATVAMLIGLVHAFMMGVTSRLRRALRAEWQADAA